MVRKLSAPSDDLCKTIKLMVLCCLMLTFWCDLTWAVKDFGERNGKLMGVHEQYKTENSNWADKCEPIIIPMCKNMRYNLTFYPNLMGQDRQDDALAEVRQYFPLVKVGCSPNLSLFLCTMFAPVCTAHEDLIKPCRELCYSAKQGCERLMNKFGFDWPDTLKCDQFPPASSKFCVYDPDMASKGNPKSRDDQPMGHKSLKWPTLKEIPSLFRRKNLTCPQMYWAPKNYDNYQVKVAGETLTDSSGHARPCGMPCNAPRLFFSGEEQATIRVWIGVFAFLSLASTLFSIVTCLIDRSRFRYPERPIIFLMICYFVVALVYVIGFLWRSHGIACNDEFEEVIDELGENTLVTKDDLVKTVARGTKKEWCAIIFMLLFFFYTASHLWWIILCLTWFLAAGLKWSHEAIENHSQYYHVFAWALPALKTIVILALQRSEGDVLSNTCFVGVLDVNSLAGFVIAPLVLYLALGALFLVLGMMSLFKIRTIVKHDGRETDRLEKLMARIGIFSVLYILANGVTIACFVYEMINRHDWIASWYVSLCHTLVKKDSVFKDICPPAVPTEGLPKPELTIFMLKYFSILVIGLVSGLWVWSKKTLKVWGTCLCGGLTTSTTKYHQRTPIVQL